MAGFLDCEKGLGCGARAMDCDSDMSCFEPKDNITRPSHYINGRHYEPKDVIRDWGLNFNLGCAVKYISRAGRKDDIIQDLKKAQTYLGFEIEALQEEQRENRHAAK